MKSPGMVVLSLGAVLTTVEAKVIDIHPRSIEENQFEERCHQRDRDDRNMDTLRDREAKESDRRQALSELVESGKVS